MSYDDLSALFVLNYVFGDFHGRRKVANYSELTTAQMLFTNETELRGLFVGV